MAHAKGTAGVGDNAALVAGGPAVWTGAAIFTRANASWDYNKGTRIALGEL